MKISLHAKDGGHAFVSGVGIEIGSFRYAWPAPRRLRFIVRILAKIFK